MVPGARVLNLRPAGGLVPSVGPVDWTQLDLLPDCLTVYWSGPDRGISDAVSARPGIRFLYWSDAEGDLDLRRTHLGTVRLDGVRLRSVRLPQGIETLLLFEPPDGLRVDAPSEGADLELRLFQHGARVEIPAGLRRTSKIWISVGGEFSAAALATLAELRDLRLTFDATPGVITEPARLSEHPHLHRLELGDAYGLDPASLPVLPQLRSLVLEGARRTTAVRLRGRFRGSPTAVSARRTKSESWLAEHLDNPFRDWVEESPAFGRAACAAYTRARRAIDAAPPDGLRAVEQALGDFVADLNAISEDIDTVYREHAWTVCTELAAGLIPVARVREWFDRDRRF